jgi:hypothetical protein
MKKLSILLVAGLSVAAFNISAKTVINEEQSLEKQILLSAKKKVAAIKIEKQILVAGKTKKGNYSIESVRRSSSKLNAVEVSRRKIK